MIILSAPRILESIKVIRIHPDIAADISRQFIPMLRFCNPKLEIKPVPTDSENLMEVLFTDGSRHVTEPLDCFHGGMQRIIDLDREKTVDILNRRQAR